MNLPSHRHRSTLLIILRSMVKDMGWHGPFRSLVLLCAAFLANLCLLATNPLISAFAVQGCTLFAIHNAFDTHAARVYGSLPVSRRGFGRLIWFAVILLCAGPPLLRILHRFISDSGGFVGEIDIKMSVLLLLTGAATGLASRFLLPPRRGARTFAALDQIYLYLLLPVPILELIGHHVDPLISVYPNVQLLLLVATLPFSLLHIVRVYNAPERVAERVRSPRGPMSSDTDAPPIRSKDRRSGPAGIVHLRTFSAAFGSMLPVVLITGATVYAMASSISRGDYLILVLGLVVPVVSGRQGDHLARNLRAFRALPMPVREVLLRHFARIGVEAIGSFAAAVAISAYFGELALTLNCAAIVLTIPALCALMPSMDFAEPSSFECSVLGLAVTAFAFGGPVLACAFPLWTIAGTLLVTPVLWWVLYLFITRSSRAYRRPERTEDVL